MSKTMLIKPQISEKAYLLSETRSTYLFDVPVNANKTSIKQAVEAQYEVGVVSVNVANYQGKLKRVIRRGGRAMAGRRNDTKRAFVKLKDGDRLPFFAAAEAETAKPEPKRRSAKESK